MYFLSDFTIDVSNISKKRDIVLSMYIACHSAICGIDHLGEVINKHFLQVQDKVNAANGGTGCGRLTLHCTKCSRIILKVILPCVLQLLEEEIGDGYFSIIVDESTDVATVKLMAYSIRYFNKKLNKIVTDFLGLQLVFTATAEDLLENFEVLMSEFGLNLERMIAIATDGATSNLCGSKHSLFILLKKKYPKLILLKCVCHSLDNAQKKPAVNFHLISNSFSEKPGFGFVIVHCARFSTATCTNP